VELNDDLSLRVARRETLVSLVDYVLESDRAGRRWPEVRDVLVERFALSYDDARLALDRVAGGRDRARIPSPANEPNRAKDPVAWIAYQRARNRTVEVPAPPDPRHIEQAANALIAKAFEAGRMIGTDDVEVALMVARIAAVRAPDAPTEADAKNLLLLAATVLSVAAEALIDKRGPQRCAAEGSQAWVDGIALAAASRQITRQFAARGWRDLELRGLSLCGRVVTGLLGQCRARVGAAMLDQIRAVRAAGNEAEATSMCEAVISDFALVVDMWEPMTEVPFDEHRIALEHLLAALDELAGMRGALTSSSATLRNRCATLLARPLDA